MSGIMQMLLGAGAVNDAILVTQYTASATSPTPTAMGAVVGDLAVMLSFGNASSGGGAWAQILSGASRGFVFWRVLTTGDMATPITTTGAGASNMVLLIFRGASSLQTVVTDNGVAPVPHTLTASGFTRNTAHAGLIGFTNNTASDSGGGGPTTGAVITSPAGFITTALPPFAVSGVQYVPAVGYRLVPGATAYVNGTSFTYGDGLSSGNTRTEYLVVLELLR